ncbi:MAG TPA: hypothetical protein PL182_02485 [Pseudobdellovibrionaceae bacterium]|nr:hypothetical protein [Pseudobdellovibrionaceae bacterium]
MIFTGSGFAEVFQHLPMQPVHFLEWIPRLLKEVRPEQVVKIRKLFIESEWRTLGSFPMIVGPYFISTPEGKSAEQEDGDQGKNNVSF